MGDQEIRGPLNFGQTLDASFKLLGRTWRPLLGMSFLVAIPLAVLAVVGVELLTTTHDVGFTIAEDSTSTEVTDYLILLAALMLVSLGPWVAAVLAYPLVSARARGERMSLSASVQLSLSRWWPLTVVSVLGGVAVFFATLACVVPGIFLGVLWVVWLPALLDEDLRGTAALGRSTRLVQGRWWATFGRYVVGALIAGAASAFVTRIGLVVATSALDPETTTALIVYFAAATAGAVVTTPLIVCLLAVIYVDLKARESDLEPRGSGESFRGFAPPASGA